MPTDDRPTDDSPRPLVPMLSYAKPSAEPPPTLKYAMAMAFASISISLGALFALNAVGMFVRSTRETTTRENRLFREDAMRMLGCSVVLIVPGLWYGRLGILGDRQDEG